MRELKIDIDIIQQMKLNKAAELEHRRQEDLVVAALEHFLQAEGYNNLASETLPTGG